MEGVCGFFTKGLEILSSNYQDFPTFFGLLDPGKRKRDVDNRDSVIVCSFTEKKKYKEKINKSHQGTIK